MPNYGSIKSVATYKGVFKQGDLGDLLLKITSLDGIPQDPSSITITISGPSEQSSLAVTVVENAVPFQVTTGYYVYEWLIDSAQTPGTYDITWEYFLDGETQYEYQTVVIAEATTAPLDYSEILMSYRIALQYHLSCAQNIPMYFEQAKTSRDRQLFRFTFKNWNQSPGVKIYKNQEIMTDNIEVDYFNGSVRFEDGLLPQDVINADYNFQWFTEDELDRFIFNSLSSINMFPPATAQYALESLPPRFTSALLYGAAKDAIRQIMMCLQFQEPSKIFGDPEAAQQAFSNFETLKKNYEADWKLILEQKRLGPYPRIRGYITPSYTLPGILG